MIQTLTNDFKSACTESFTAPYYVLLFSLKDPYLHTGPMQQQAEMSVEKHGVWTGLLLGFLLWRRAVEGGWKAMCQWAATLLSTVLLPPCTHTISYSDPRETRQPPVLFLTKIILPIELIQWGEVQEKRTARFSEACFLGAVMKRSGLQQRTCL